MRFKKGNTPYNKGVVSEKKLKKIERYQQGLPIECKHHGLHDKWRLHSGNNVQCLPCAANWQRSQRKRDPLRFVFRDAKKHARDHVRSFDIDLEDLENQMNKQDGKCAITGVPFSEKELPSLDRIDSSLGYIKQNIQLVLIKINKMKSNLEQNEFIELCKKVASNCG